jgi:ketosteroid isomerase-like protein
VTSTLSADDVTVAEQLFAAVDQDDLEAVYALFSDDIEYITDRRTLRGIDELREKLS